MRVSLPLTAERGRIRIALAGLSAMAVLAVAAIGSAAPASAALTACESGAPTGAVSEIGIQGSSLQKSAIEFWNSTKIYRSENLTAFGCGSGAGTVTYTSKSSGCGLDAVGAGIAAEGCSLSGEYTKPGYRDEKARIGATDFAPDPEEQASIDDGPTGGQQAGKIHVIPVASAAVAVVVHFPEGCELEDPGTGKAAGGTGTVNDDTTSGGVNDPTGLETGDTAAAQSLRLHIPAKALEEIWEHKITTWGAIPTPVGGSTLAPHMVGTPTGADAADTCASAPIFRIARFDTSGTTFNFKAYLSLLPSFSEDGGTKLWKEGQVGSTNTAWPLADAAHPGTPAEVPKEEGKTGSGKTKAEGGGEVTGPTNECSVAISVNQICRATAEGGGSLAAAVKATDGSIGYLDVATARKEGFTIEVSKNDDTYWLPLEAINPSVSEPEKRVDTGVFFEPTLRPAAHFTTTTPSEKGANCEEADYRGIPTTPSDPTLGDWSSAIATGGGAYPVCAITYDLAFDDDSTVYGGGSLQEEKARTVKEYLTSVISVPGQSELPEFDYGTLPNTKTHPLLEDAQKGIAAIGWEKTAGAAGSKEEPKTTTPTPTPTPTPGVTPPSVIPSNAFSIAGAKVKGKAIVLSLVLPDAGSVQVKAIGGGISVSSVNASVSGGSGNVTLAISKAALSKLAKVKGHKLSVKITVTFTPTGGTAASASKTLTLTQAELSTKKATKKKATKKGKK
jgi:ABC-type phosphate transport system substrate-binding protein